MLKKIIGIPLMLAASALYPIFAQPYNKIGVVLQKNEMFMTDWDTISIPQNMKLILITNSNPNKISKEDSHFDDVITLDDFSEHAVGKTLEKIVEKHEISNQKIILATHDEYAIDMAASLREKYKVPGHITKDIMPYRNKAYAKSLLRSTNVIVPRYISFDPEAYKSDAMTYITHIEDLISYPMFTKPIDEARCADVAKIENREDLIKWADSHNTDNYEIEEFVDGELYTSICVIQDGEITHHGVHKFMYPCFEFMNSKKALGGYTLPFDHMDTKKLRIISENVVNAFPLADTVIHIEVMKKGNGDFVFIEAAARQPGGYISHIYNKKSNINLGLLHYQLQLGLPVHLDAKDEFHGAWYWPHKPDGVVSERLLPEIDSQFTHEWRVEVGETYKGSQFLGDSSVRLMLWTKDFETLKKDVKYLEEQYQPTT